MPNFFDLKEKTQVLGDHNISINIDPEHLSQFSHYIVNPILSVLIQKEEQTLKLLHFGKLA